MVVGAGGSRRVSTRFSYGLLFTVYPGFTAARSFPSGRLVTSGHGRDHAQLVLNTFLSCSAGLSVCAAVRSTTGVVHTRRPSRWSSKDLQPAKDSPASRERWKALRNLRMRTMCLQALDRKVRGLSIAVRNKS